MIHQERESGPCLPLERPILSMAFDLRLGHGRTVVVAISSELKWTAKQTHSTGDDLAAPRTETLDRGETRREVDFFV